MTVLALLLIWVYTARARALAVIDHADHIIAAVNDTHALLLNMEIAQRGYLVGGSPALLQDYRQARDKMPELLATLDDRTHDDPDTRPRVTAIHGAYAAWVAGLDRQVSARAVSAGSPSAPPAYQSAFNDPKSQDQTRAVLLSVSVLLTDIQQGRESMRSRTRFVTDQVITYAAFVIPLAALALCVTTVRQMRGLSRQYEDLIDAEQQARERLATTLTSIGDAVFVTDVRGRVTMMNPIAQTLTGWTETDAHGVDAKSVFDIINEDTRAVIDGPVDKVLREGNIVALANHTILRRRDGSEIFIDDSGAPIRGRDGALTGVVVVFRDVSERRRAEEELAQAAARQARIAETLQQSILLAPPPDAFAGLRIDTRYEPASAEAELGGDFHDAFSVGADQVALVVGDVMGKGLKAAAFTAEVKFALRAILREEADPASSLHRLNRLLLEGRRFDLWSVNSLVAVAVTVIDTTSGVARCSLGGAEPPLVLRRASGTFETLDALGSLVGADDTPEYVNVQVALASGDLVLMATDGLTEARHGGEFFGPEGIGASAANALRATPPPTLETISDTIVSDARAFARGSFRDDVCLLVVERRVDG